MRVLLYTEAFFPSIGGIERSTAGIAQYLFDRGVTVTVLTKTPWEGEEPFPYTVVRASPLSGLDDVVADCDIVHMNAFDVRLFFSAKRLRRKIVCTYRDLTMICPKGTKWKTDGPCLHPAGPFVCTACLRASKEPLARRLARPALKAFFSMFIDANVCTSSFGMRRFPLWRKRLISNGIDTSFFLPAAHVAPNATQPPRVVVVARLIPEKGVGTVLEAQRRCAEAGTRFRLEVCGEGPDLPRLERLAEDYGLRQDVVFHGALRRPELLSVMQTGALAVVPSEMDEPFGRTAIEAMSCGLPVVASDVGGLGDIVREAGLVFPRADSKALASQIERLLTDPDLRRELGTSGRRLATRKYDVEVMGGAYLDLYRELSDPAA